MEAAASSAPHPVEGYATLDQQAEEEWVARLGQTNCRSSSAVRQLLQDAPAAGSVVGVVRAVERTVHSRSSPEDKLSVLFVMDFMCRNLPPAWAEAFGSNVVTTVCRAFEAARTSDRDLEGKYLDLLRAWAVGGVFASGKIKAIAVRLQAGLRQRRTALLHNTLPSARIQLKLLDRQIEQLELLTKPFRPPEVAPAPKPPGSTGRRTGSATPARGAAGTPRPGPTPASPATPNWTPGNTPLPPPYCSVTSHSSVHEEEEEESEPEIYEVQTRNKRQKLEWARTPPPPPYASPESPAYATPDPPPASPLPSRAPLASRPLPLSPQVMEMLQDLGLDIHDVRVTAKQIAQLEELLYAFRQENASSEQVEQLQQLITLLKDAVGHHAARPVVPATPRASPAGRPVVGGALPAVCGAALAAAAVAAGEGLARGTAAAAAGPRSDTVQSILRQLGPLLRSTTPAAAIPAPVAGPAHPAAVALYRPAHQCPKCGYRLPTAALLQDHLHAHDQLRLVRSCVKARPWHLAARDWLLFL